MVSLRIVLALCVGVAVGSKFLDPADNQDLKSDFSAMMDDDDDDDVVSGGDMAGGGSLLQSKHTDQAMKAYMEDSANALSTNLGDRWNGKKLEANAKAQTN